MSLKQIRPCGGTNHITGETSTTAVYAIQSIVTAAPVVGQKNHAVHVVHLCLGVSDTTCGAASIEDVVPLTLRQRAPLVGRVASITN